VFSWSVPQKRVRKWMWIGLGGVAALQFYYVREMIAAFVVLGVLFAVVAGAGLLMFLVDRASARTLNWMETFMPTLLHAASAGVNFVAMLAAKRAAERGAQVSLFNRTPLRHPR